MNVIISNQQDNIINNLDIEVIKSLQGEYDVDEIISNFSNFFFARMIIDVTALKDYENIVTYQKLSIGLSTDKIILLIPSQSVVSNNDFLSKLISMGFYNFTTNADGIHYLLDNPNTYKDVAHIHQIDTTPEPSVLTDSSIRKKVILGIKNLTDGAGATTLTYMLYKELSAERDINVIAFEVNKHDFMYFNDDNLKSVSNNELASVLLKNQQQDVILVDINDGDVGICTDVLYLIEPSIIKLNKLMKKNRNFVNNIKDKKVVLNKCVLTKGDVKEFEREVGTKIFYYVPPVDDRTRQESIIGLLSTLGIISKIK